ncbi:MAG TPA: OmpA family protein [Acidobacteriaceae bacterium]
MASGAKVIAAGSVAAFFMLLGSAVSAGAQQGIIVSRNGDTFVMTTAEGPRTTVVLTADTDTRDKRGLFGWGREHLGDTVLMPGLKVDVDGTADERGRVIAKKITVDGDDIEASQMIQAGLNPTAEQVEANVQRLSTHEKTMGEMQQNMDAKDAAHDAGIAETKEQLEQNIKDDEAQNERFKALADYDVKGEATVKFAVGSTKLSPEDEEQLKTLAQTTSGMRGYTVEVIGFADSTGNAAMNTKLSENRAREVINFLVQQGGVPVRFIVAPGAMGEYGPAGSNETKEGRADNRRVEVKILVNKGVAGSDTAGQ